MGVSLALPLRDRLRDRARMVPVPWRGATLRKSRRSKWQKKTWGGEINIPWREDGSPESEKRFYRDLWFWSSKRHAINMPLSTKPGPIKTPENDSSA